MGHSPRMVNFMSLSKKMGINLVNNECLIFFYQHYFSSTILPTNLNMKKKKISLFNKIQICKFYCQGLSQTLNLLNKTFF